MLYAGTRKPLNLRVIISNIITNKLFLSSKMAEHRGQVNEIVWQGRFKSWYVTDEVYLYTLMCYIEQNPLKAKLVKSLEEYPYSSYHYFLNKEISECLKDAWVVQHYKKGYDAIETFLKSKIDTSQLQEMKKASSLVEAPAIHHKHSVDNLKKRFKKTLTTKERNAMICEAYKDGYSQHMIARVLGMAQSTVSAIVRKGMK